MGYDFANSAGINYAGHNSTVNRDNAANIRYGIIPQHDVLQAWCDSSEPVYPPADFNDDENDDENDSDCDYCEPIGHGLKADGYRAFCGEDGDIFITKAPYFTYAQFCSPCAPGACHLRNPLPPFTASDDNKAYCFGHDWFEDDAAPYPVFSVETGLIVEPTK